MKVCEGKFKLLTVTLMTLLINATMRHVYVKAQLHRRYHNITIGSPQSLPDGSLLTLVAVTFGKTHRIASKKTQRLLPMYQSDSPKAMMFWTYHNSITLHESVFTYAAVIDAQKKKYAL
jgi:hypothetical protein